MERFLPLTPPTPLSPVALAVSAALLALAPAAWAQSPPASPPAEAKPDVQTLVITATKRDVPASRVPINVTAVGEEQLREENITDLKKLIANSPSIDAPANGARFADSVTVRGLNISPVNANNIEWFVRSTLSYYLDDTPLPNIGYRIKDIARVETLLGPQGTLYGAGALGGTVRYITNQPKFGSSEARLSTSLYQTRYGGLSNDTDGVVNVPLGKDLALRVSLSRLDEKGYTDRFAGVPTYLAGGTPWTPTPDASRTLYEDDDWQKVNSGRVALRWRLTRDLEMTLSHAQQSQLAHGTSGAQLLPASGNPARYQTPLAFNDHTVLSPYEEYADRDFRMTSFDLDWKLPIGKLHSSTSRYEDSRVGQADYLAFGSFYYGELGYSRYRIKTPGFQGRTAYFGFDNTYTGTVHETRLASNPGAVEWIAGLYYADQQRSLKFTENLPTVPTSGPAGVGYFENQASQYQETALFGEVSVKPVDRLTLTAGARVFSFRDDTTTEVVDYAFDLVSGVVKGREKDHGKAYFKFNAAYQATPDLLGYATFSQGFRRGGANGFRPVGGVQVAPALRTFKPDSTDNIEVGLKGLFLDKRLYLQANVYSIRWKDTQTYFDQDVEGFPVNGTTNGPDAVSRGFEWQGRMRLPGGWQLTGASTYTHARWDDTKQVCLYVNNTACRTYEKGGELGGSPRWKHMLGVRWEGLLAGDLGVNASLRARHTGRKAADRADVPGQTVLTYDAYTVFNASVGVSKGKWDASLWVDNLTDDRTLVSYQGAAAVGSRTGVRAIYVTPRTIGVNLSYHFK
jgi:outer membrane receptor protein involved in Fe transport